MHGFYRGPVYSYNPRRRCAYEQYCNKKRNLDRQDCAREYRNCYDTGNNQCTRSAVKCVRQADGDYRNCTRNLCRNSTKLIPQVLEGIHNIRYYPNIRYDPDITYRYSTM